MAQRVANWYSRYGNKVGSADFVPITRSNLAFRTGSNNAVSQPFTSREQFAPPRPPGQAQLSAVSACRLGLCFTPRQEFSILLPRGNRPSTLTGRSVCRGRKQDAAAEPPGANTDGSTVDERDDH